MITLTEAVAITQLTIYIILLPLITYLLYTHGKRGILGWSYLFLFCTLQLISAGLQISKPENTTAAILSSVGLSPILLGLAGIVHEAHQYLSLQNSDRAKLGYAFQLALHIVTIAGIVLIAISTSNLYKEDVGTSSYNSNLTLRKVGAIILLVAFMAIAALAGWVLPKVHSSQDNMAKRLFWSTLPAFPLIFVRLIYTIVYSFAKPNSHTFITLSPPTASIAIRVVFVLLLLLLAVISLIVGGLLSRQLAQHGNERGQMHSQDYRGGEMQNLTQK